MRGSMAIPCTISGAMYSAVPVMVRSASHPPVAGSHILATPKSSSLIDSKVSTPEGRRAG